MPRIRYLKPEFFKDEDLAELSFETRLFFAGLWNFADKAGRLEDRPLRLKVEIFPYDKVNIEMCLVALSQPKNGSGRPFIQRYVVENEKYIQIVNWGKHQKPHHTEGESKIPPCPPLDIKTMEKGMGMEKQHEGGMELRNGEVTVNKPLNKEDTPASPCSFSFKDIYERYPSKIGRKAAERHFAVTVKTDQDWKGINAALDNYLKSEKVVKGFIQNASTWFNDWQAWEKVVPVSSAPKIVKSEPLPPREELSEDELKEIRSLVQSVTAKCKKVI